MLCYQFECRTWDVEISNWFYDKGLETACVKVRYKYGSFWAKAQVLFGLAVSADRVVWDGVYVHFKQRPSEYAYCHCAEKSHANLSAHG